MKKIKGIFVLGLMVLFIFSNIDLTAFATDSEQTLDEANNNGETNTGNVKTNNARSTLDSFSDNMETDSIDGLQSGSMQRVFETIKFDGNKLLLQVNVNLDEQTLTNVSINTSLNASQITDVKVYEVDGEGAVGAVLSTSTYAVDPSTKEVTFLTPISTDYAIVYTTTITPGTIEITSVVTADASYSETVTRTFTPIETVASSTTIFENFKLYNEMGNEITSESSLADIGDSVKIEYYWNLKTVLNIEDGAYITFQIPDIFEMHNAVSGFLGDYGTIYIDQTGHGIIILNANADASKSGSFSLLSSIDKEKIDEGLNIKVPVSDDTSVEVIIPGDTKEVSISKTGAFNATEDAIDWTIIFNQEKEELKNAKITDVNLTTGGSTVLSVAKANTTIKVYELNNDGGISKTLVEGVDYTFVNPTSTTTTAVISLIGEYATTNATFKIDFATPIVAQAGTATDTFINQATLTSENQPAIVAKATVSRSKNHLAKKAISYDPVTNTITWEIRYNLDEQTIPVAKAVITDTPDTRYKVVEDSVLVYPYIGLTTTDPKNNAIIIKDSEINDAVNCEYIGNGVIIKFNEDDGNGNVTKGYIIRYKTELNSTGTGLPEELTTSVVNRVTTGDDHNAESKYTLSMLKKETGNVTVGLINSADRTIAWNVTINQNQSELNNLVFTDTFETAGLSTEGLSNFNLIITNQTTGIALKENIDYKIENNGSSYVNANGESKKGFQIIFIGDYATKMKATLKITFNTTWDVAALVKNAETRFINGATITADNQSLSTTATSTPISIFMKGGAKSGVYDATKKKITWSVIANSNYLTIEDPVLTDTLPKGQKYVEGSLKLYTLKIDQWGTQSSIVEVTGVTPIVSTEVQGDSTKIIVKLVDADNKPVKLDYRILYRFDTEITDDLIKSSYTNTASLTWVGDDKLGPWDATLSIAGANTYISKVGTVDASNKYLTWQLTANPNGSTLSNVVITDQLVGPQTFIESSFKLYAGIIEKDVSGKIVVNKSDTQLIAGQDYDIVIIENTKVEIKLKGTYETIKMPIIIEYQSYYADGKSITLSNKATITADGGLNDKTEDQIIIKNTSMTSSGGGSTTLNITKVDMFGGAIINEDDSKRAIFTLWNNEQTAKISGCDRITTDANGNLTFTGLGYATYYLQEVQSPSGYQILDEVIEIKLSYNPFLLKEVITATGMTTGKHYIVSEDNVVSINNNPVVEVPVVKTWVDNNDADGKRPESIQVTVLQNGVTYGEAQTVSKDTDWKYTFEDLPKYDVEGNAYEYTIKEASVDGYKTTINGFTITNTLLTKISGTKTWVDNNDADGKRPESIMIALLQNGVAYREPQTISEDTNWEYTFVDLPKYDEDGNAYKYTVKEVSVDGYKTSTDGFNITNTLLTKISGTKTWIDNNNTDGKRPESITVTLLQNGIAYGEPRTVSEDTNWEYTFVDLPKYDIEGNAYKYTVEEVSVEGYITHYDGANIINEKIAKKEENRGKTEGNVNTGDTTISLGLYTGLLMIGSYMMLLLKRKKEI